MRILPTQEFVENKIPSRIDFRNALIQFENQCVLPYLKKAVVGSFVYGSMNRNDFNLASDIDYFMIINDETHKKRVREATQRAINEWNVSIQTRVIPVDHAMSGLHKIDSGLRQHYELSVRKNGFKGTNPLELLVEDKTPIQDSLRRRMLQYLISLDNEFTNYQPGDEGYVRFLEQIMVKPVHAMRMFIQYMSGSVEPKNNKHFQDTKMELLKTYAFFGLNHGLIEDISTIISVRGDYVRLLEDRRAGEISDLRAEHAYNVMLTKMLNCYPQAHKFIEQNLKLMN